MTSADYGIIVLLFGVTEGLIEVIKLLIYKMNRKNGNGKSNGNSSDIHALESKIDALYNSMQGSEDFKRKMLAVADILSYKDADGIPFCYTPRNLIKLSERTLEKLDVIISLLSKERK